MTAASARIIAAASAEASSPAQPDSVCGQCQCQCQSKIFSVAKIAKLLRRPRGRSVIKSQCQEKTGEKKCFQTLTEDREEDAWMSDGNEFQTSDAATANVRRPTVVSRNDGTSSWCDDAD